MMREEHNYRMGFRGSTPNAVHWLVSVEVPLEKDVFTGFPERGQLER